jgi:hypothetical protein
MKRIDLSNLLASSSNIAMFADKIAQMIERLGGDHGMVELKHDRVVLFFRSICQVIDTAEWLELPATVSAAKRAQVLVGRLARSDRVLISRPVGREIVAAAHQLTESMSAELEKHHTYVVMPREGLLLDQGPGAFGSELLDVFPEVRQDVSAAAHCRAYELWTACIMHLMRVAEVGIGRLADHIGAPRGNSWGATAANLSKALENARKVDGDGSAKQWLSEAGTYLNFVKNGFRNPAMHPNKSFDREQAIAIYDNTRNFMRLIAARLAP